LAFHFEILRKQKSFREECYGQSGVSTRIWGIARIRKQEARMIKGVLKLGTLATFVMALGTAPSPTPAFAAGGGGDPPSAYPTTSAPPPSPSAYPKRSGTKATHKLKKTKQSSLDDSTFGQGYRAAYATIYDRNDYAAAIEQLKALGHDDHPNVAI
jgi:hypothetical protein